MCRLPRAARPRQPCRGVSGTRGAAIGLRGVAAAALCQWHPLQRAERHDRNAQQHHHVRYRKASDTGGDPQRRLLRAGPALKARTVHTMTRKLSLIALSAALLAIGVWFW